MKISRKEQDKTRKRLLAAAVEVVTAKGFRLATMREIAKTAGVGSATIYNYFPTKEHILFGYCEEKQAEVARLLESIPDFHQYSLREQLQTLAETEIEVVLAEREFVAEIYDLAFYSPMTSHRQLAETRHRFQSMVDELLDAAIEVEEIPEQPFRELMLNLAWDYYLGILGYWLRDDSRDFTRTTRLIDQSLEIVTIVLATGLLGKTLDLASFFLRSHVLNRMDQLLDLVGAPDKGKRPFKPRFDHE